MESSHSITKVVNSLIHSEKEQKIQANDKNQDVSLHRQDSILSPYSRSEQGAWAVTNHTSSTQIKEKNLSPWLYLHWSRRANNGGEGQPLTLRNMRNEKKALDSLQGKVYIWCYIKETKSKTLKQRCSEQIGEIEDIGEGKGCIRRFIFQQGQWPSVYIVSRSPVYTIKHAECRRLEKFTTKTDLFQPQA